MSLLLKSITSKVSIILNLIGTIGGKVLDIVDDVVEANKLKFQFQRQHIETKSSELEAQEKIVLAEVPVA